MKAIVQGRTNKGIAATFGTTERTIKNQLTTLYHKVGVRSRLELAIWALRHADDRE